ncbi:glutaredoxin family protein [Rhodococcus sp. 14C212]|uniref:glutaredoxin family protein n=1 Tax=Rhodococcus sp. 14C212 TaxID=2711209 RepID=UPI0013EC0390|nr:glutaredoxin family protein [Rhodococcus sp. 14C212]NGP09606.1 glutaredoxin family protein [Rhodococcus sp. 14C212]
MSEHLPGSATTPGTRHEITLLVRAGCGACAPALTLLEQLCDEFGAGLTCIDVDRAASTDPDLRAEFGDRLPVVLLDGREHSYWEVDEPRLRADLAG